MESNRTKRKKPSLLPGIMSLALVMFMLGLLGFTVLGFEGLSRNMAEGSSVDVYFQDSVNESTVLDFQKKINAEKWLRKSVYISREEGFKQMGEKYDADIMEYAQASELPLSMELYFVAESATPEFIAKTARELEANPLVEAVVYQKNLLEKVSKNVKNIQWILLGLSALFILISIGLINSTTRLSIFAHRFLIKSMQLVGATNTFIIRPFILKSVYLALLAIPVATCLLFGLLYGLHFVWKEFATINEFAAYINWQHAAVIFAGIAIFGILLASICAWFSTRKYLRSKIENLY
jgi:cell division transport system permease protein